MSSARLKVEGGSSGPLTDLKLKAGRPILKPVVARRVSLYVWHPRACAIYPGLTWTWEGWRLLLDGCRKSHLQSVGQT